MTPPIWEESVLSWQRRTKPLRWSLLAALGATSHVKLKVWVSALEDRGVALRRVGGAAETVDSIGVCVCSNM